jgi:predicted dehydrogenase
MPPPARVALLGYGLAGAVLHAPFIATTPGLRLAGIVTRNEERRNRARRDHPGVSLLDSAEQVWAKADEFDVVVVAAPNRAHVALALGALEAGLPVVVDKPLAGSAADGRALVERARERGLMLTVFQNRRWDGDFLTLRGLLQREALGQVYRFESRFERWRPQIVEGWRELASAEEAGGVLFDLGSHLVDQAIQLFGPVRTVYGELANRRSGAVVDDDAFVALEHVSGVHSHLWMSSVAAQKGPRLRVLGERAAYTKDGPDVQEEALRAGLTPGGPGWGKEAEELWGELGIDGELRKIPTEPGSYGAFYEALVAGLRTGGPPPVDPDDAVAVLEILDAVRLGHEEREGRS